MKLIMCVYIHARWRVMGKRRRHHDQSLYFPITPASISLMNEVNPPPRQGQSPEKWCNYMSLNRGGEGERGRKNKRERMCHCGCFTKKWEWNIHSFSFSIKRLCVGICHMILQGELTCTELLCYNTTINYSHSQESKNILQTHMQLYLICSTVTPSFAMYIFLNFIWLSTIWKV